MTRNRSNPPRLLTAGYLTLDMIVRDLATGDYWHSAGGTCGNVSIFATALNLDVSLLARIGADHRGQRVLDHMNDAGVNTDDIEEGAALRTPGIVELIRGTSERTHRFTHQCPLCATRLPKIAVASKRQAKTKVKHIDRFDAFFFDRATLSTITLATAAREAGLIVMFEPPSVPRTQHAIRAAELSDIVKLSRRPASRIKNWSLNPNGATKFIIETLGPKGARFCTKLPGGWSNWTELPAFSTSHVNDTAGAGDWLTAGLLADLLIHQDVVNLDSLQASIEYGQKLSSISIAFDGPHGALTVLGASGIQQAAACLDPIHPPCDHAEIRPAPTNPVADPPYDYCKLCLTQFK